MEQNKHIPLIVAALLIGVVAGYVVGSIPAQNEIKTLRAQIDSVKNLFPQTPEMRSLSGQVKSVAADSLIFDVSGAISPLEQLPTTRTVHVANDTKLIRLVPKSAAAFQKELSDFQKNIQSANLKTPPVPPQPFTQTTIKLSDLKTGDIVIISAHDNIKTATEFTATEISVQQSNP